MIKLFIIFVKYVAPILNIEKIQVIRKSFEDDYWGKTSIEFDLTHYKFADCHHITLFYSIKKALIIINFSINPLK